VSFYHHLAVPATAANEAMVVKSVNSRTFIPTSPSGGTNGSASLYPFWGRFKRFMTNFLLAAALPLRRQPTWGPLQWYAVGLLVALGGLTTAVLNSGVSLGAPLWVLAILGLVALVAERQSVRMSPNMETSVSVLPILFAAVVYGPVMAIGVAACALLGEFGRPHTRWVIWTTSRALAGGVAGVAAMSVMGDGTSFSRVLPAVALATFAESVCNVTLMLLTAVLRGNVSREAAYMIGRLFVGTVPLYTPVIAALAYAYQALSPWTVLLFFIPALAAQRLLLLYQEQRKLAEDLAVANTRLEKASLSFATALVSALDARDRYTAGHSAAVAVYARDIASRLELSPQDQRTAHLAGLLHDIGKVGLPAGILEKSGPLTLEERRRMEEHSAIGERILAKVDGFADIARIVRHHHERVDGNGYPDGLSNYAIPLISRILCVADAYNAMTSGRPYRDAMASRVARMRLAQGVETQFDTTVVAAFEAILAGASETYRCGARADFTLEAQHHPVLGVGEVTQAA
jgi:putative nucleotidyltransferase with HDIG domain